MRNFSQISLTEKQYISWSVHEHPPPPPRRRTNEQHFNRCCLYKLLCILNDIFILSNFKGPIVLIISSFASPPPYISKEMNEDNGLRSLQSRTETYRLATSLLFSQKPHVVLTCLSSVNVSCNVPSLNPSTGLELANSAIKS